MFVCLEITKTSNDEVRARLHLGLEKKLIFASLTGLEML